MRFITRTNLDGNCLQTCVACIFDLPVESVPDRLSHSNLTCVHPGLTRVGALWTFRSVTSDRAPGLALFSGSGGPSQDLRHRSGLPARPRGHFG
jgi:hypothetical protein